MAPKGSPRMLLAASLLASTDGKLPVKVALSRAGFSADEIAKEKKQRQARRRRDFLLKKRAMNKIKGRRAMSILPRCLPRQVITFDQQEQPYEFMNTSSFDSVLNNDQEENQDTSRLDALILACSMQKPIAETAAQTTVKESPYTMGVEEATSSSSSSCSTSFEPYDHSCTSI